MSLKVFEYNSDTLQLSISLNETNYTISNGKYSTTNGFCESTELPPLILMCKEYLDFSYKNCNNKNIIKTKNGYIEEINVDSIIYKFYEHKSTSVK